MKRGFLKPRKVAPAARAEHSPSKPILIPVSPQYLPDVPGIAEYDFQFDSFRIASFPKLNIPTYFLLYPGAKEAIREQFQPFKGVPLLSSFPFIIKEVPGKGRGAFVKKAYNTGDLIWDERPILVVPQALPNLDGSPEYHYLKTAIDVLPPYFKTMFYNLHNCRSDNPQDPLGIIFTNALGVGRIPGPYEGNHVGIFVTTSRINHSCVPNVLYTWNPKTFSYYLAALRPISAGEEIFISYLNFFRPRTERQGTLSSGYAFTCTCPSCTLPKDLSARSDVKRKILWSARATVPKQQKEHEHALKEWIADSSLPDDHHLKTTRLLMQLMEEEQALDPVLWLTQAEIACKALCALSDRAGVVELAQKASAYAKANFFGDDAGWSKVAAAPEKTGWWGLRKKSN